MRSEGWLAVMRPDGEIGRVKSGGIGGIVACSLGGGGDKGYTPSVLARTDRNR